MKTNLYKKQIARQALRSLWRAHIQNDYLFQIPSNNTPLILSPVPVLWKLDLK